MLMSLTVCHTLGCLPGKHSCNTKGNRGQINVDLEVGGNDMSSLMSKYFFFFSIPTSNFDLFHFNFSFNSHLILNPSTSMCVC